MQANGLRTNPRTKQEQLRKGSCLELERHEGHQAGYNCWKKSALNFLFVVHLLGTDSSLQAPNVDRLDEGVSLARVCQGLGFCCNHLLTHQLCMMVTMQLPKNKRSCKVSRSCIADRLGVRRSVSCVAYKP